MVNLSGNGGSLKIDRQLLAASLLDGAFVSVGVSQSAAFDVPSLVMTLDRYPYGCAEQTTSRAMPLLYVAELSKAAGMPEDPDLHGRIQDAIYRVLNYQSTTGSFGLWSPGSGDMWLDSYVTDFLTRAREQDYDVPRQAMLQALSNLQNSLAYDVDLQERSAEVAYALYVLARNHKASVGDLRYYADTRIEQFDSPMARAQLAASLALYGDAQRAEKTFAAALSLALDNTEVNYYRTDYGSQLRDGAAMLALAAETKPMPAAVPAMIRFVAAARAKVSYTSTQDEAWMLLAARAIKEGNQAITLDINGSPHTGPYSTRVTGDVLLNQPITVANPGPDPLEAVVTTVAAPSQPLAGQRQWLRDHAHLLQSRRQRSECDGGQAERALCGRSQGQPVEQLGLARAGQRSPACRLRDRQSAAGQQRRPHQLPVAGADRSGASRVPRRPFHRGVQPGSKCRCLVHAGLCRARRDPGHLRPSGGERRRHVPAGILGPYGFGCDGGQGALT